MPRPVVAVNFAFWADCFRNPPVFAVTAPLPKKFSDTFWEPCLCAFPYLIRYGLRDVCLARRPRAQRAGDGAASAAPPALPPTCIKDFHLSLWTLSNIIAFSRLLEKPCLSMLISHTIIFHCFNVDFAYGTMYLL